MARIRSIKPEFFLNEDLAELASLTRIIFIGLWTQADRSGRMEYRPKRLKVAIIPYDKGGIEPHIEVLAKAGFVELYEVDDQQFLRICKFEKHQSPNVKEQPSTLPAPDEHGASTVQAPCKHTGEEGRGEESKTPSSNAARFDAFWSLYPKKVGKKAAKAKWITVTKETEPDVILAALKAYKFDTRDGGTFIPHPTTWLNQGRWEDEFTPTTKLCFRCRGDGVVLSERGEVACTECQGTGRTRC